MHGLRVLGQKQETEIGPVPVGGVAVRAWNMCVAQMPTARENFMIMEL